MKAETLDGLVGKLCAIGAPFEALGVAWVRLAHVHEGLEADRAVGAALWCYSGRPGYARFPEPMHTMIETR